MLSLEDVMARRDEVVVKLDKAIKGLSKLAEKEDAPLPLIKRYHKYLQNRKNLANMPLNERNYKHLMKGIRITETDVNKYLKNNPEVVEPKEEVKKELTPEEKAKQEQEAYQETLVKFFKFAGAGKKKKVEANAIVYGDTLF